MSEAKGGQSRRALGGGGGDTRNGVNISKRKMSSALSLESETEMKITFLLFKCAAGGWRWGGNSEELKCCFY